MMLITLAKHCRMHIYFGTLYNLLKKASSSVESIGIHCALVYVIVLVLSVLLLCVGFNNHCSQAHYEFVRGLLKALNLRP
jgi:hypothetical protein